jgi:hypothetical protein
MLKGNTINPETKKNDLIILSAVISHRTPQSIERFKKYPKKCFKPVY